MGCGRFETPIEKSHRKKYYQFLRGKIRPFGEGGASRIGQVHNRQQRVVARGEIEYLKKTLEHSSWPEVVKQQKLVQGEGFGDLASIEGV